MRNEAGSLGQGYPRRAIKAECHWWRGYTSESAASDCRASAHEQTDNKDHKEHKEQNFRDARRGSGDTTKTKKRGYQRDHQENYRIVKHSNLSSRL
jgi:hypothetical protein